MNWIENVDFLPANFPPISKFLLSLYGQLCLSLRNLIKIVGPEFSFDNWLFCDRRYLFVNEVIILRSFYVENEKIFFKCLRLSPEVRFFFKFRCDFQNIFFDTSTQILRAIFGTILSPFFSTSMISVKNHFMCNHDKICT